MEREQRKHIIVSKKHGPPSKRNSGGSSNNSDCENDEGMIIPFPKLINSRHEEQRKKFEQMMARKIMPNNYMNTYFL